MNQSLNAVCPGCDEQVELVVRNVDVSFDSRERSLEMTVHASTYTHRCAGETDG